MSAHGTPGGYRAQATHTIRDEPRVRASVLSGTDRANAKRDYAYAQVDAERWRDWGRDVKTHALTHLDRFLEEAERSLEASGVHVHWAETAADALTVLRGIVRNHDVRSVVKAKSMLTEELGVNETWNVCACVCARPTSASTSCSSWASRRATSSRRSCT